MKVKIGIEFEENFDEISDDIDDMYLADMVEDIVFLVEKKLKEIDIGVTNYCYMTENDGTSLEYIEGIFGEK